MDITVEEGCACGDDCQIGGWYNSPFDVDKLLSYFPEFGNSEVYSNELLTAAGKRARFWISKNGCAQLFGEEREYAYYCIVGHLAVLTQKAMSSTDPSKAVPAGGSAGAVGGSGLIQSASVGGVNVSFQVPQYMKSSWDWWLAQTPYGQQYLAFLESRVPIGIYGMGDDIRSCLRD